MKELYSAPVADMVEVIAEDVMTASSVVKEDQVVEE